METKRIKAKVIMLPTKQSNIVKVHEYNSLHLLKGDEHPNNTILNLGIPQHLYFTTDGEIKEGDWVVCLDEIDSTVQNWSVSQAIFKYNNGGNCNSDMKIVATTDTSLGLPEPSQAFIQKYCELGGIDKVDIELKSSDLDYFFGDLKVDPIHNTVTIHSIKDSWNREEIYDLLSKAEHEISGCGCREADTVIEYIKNNL